ncbi:MULTISPECIES: FecCD family ABC transporter permease [Microbacterium]|uniref:FecCD family ABC transporter permease n=1 Tax=Microbacterium TaxID=33882 RepID=UPI001F10DF93|nr:MULTISPECIES: iron ABC transporter permease [Microbacterium]
MIAPAVGRTLTAGPLERVRRRRTRRSRVVVGALVLVTLALVVIALSTGDYPLSLAQLWRTVWGGGERVEEYVLFQVRAPRVAMAVAVGACLGVAGALLQALLRNPLASPDLLGVSGGSSVAAVFVLLVLGITGPVLAVAAFAGGLAVAILLLWAARRSGEGGFRLILAGIGISFLTVSITGYLMVRAQVELAASALVWMTGSLSATAWWHVAVIVLVGVLTLPAVLAAARWLPITQLGASAASGLGVRPETARLVTVVAAVLLTAVTCAFAGPISFIALCAPAIARPLHGHGAIAIGSSALVGATLLTAADLVAQFALPGYSLPVGVVTGALGAVFLLWILATSKGRQL